MAAKVRTNDVMRVEPDAPVQGEMHSAMPQDDFNLEPVQAQGEDSGPIIVSAIERGDYMEFEVCPNQREGKCSHPKMVEGFERRGKGHAAKYGGKSDHRIVEVNLRDNKSPRDAARIALREFRLERREPRMVDELLGVKASDF